MKLIINKMTFEFQAESDSITGIGVRYSENSAVKRLEMLSRDNGDSITARGHAVHSLHAYLNQAFGRM